MSLLAEKLPANIYELEEPKFSHYADSVSVTEGYITGKAVVAICGKIFVPSRDPKKFPICSICKEIAEALFLGEE
jgi:hypothetical protein